MEVLNLIFDLIPGVIILISKLVSLTKRILKNRKRQVPKIILVFLLSINKTKVIRKRLIKHELKPNTKLFFYIELPLRLNNHELRVIKKPYSNIEMDLIEEEDEKS